MSDMSAQAPVGTTLALLERQLKVMSAVQARMHYSFKQELNLLADIIKDYTDPDYDYDPDSDAPRKAKREDYAHLDIIPVSDPNAATMSQRVVQYQAVIQMAQMAPDIYDLPKLHRGMLEVLGIKDADKLVPLPDDQKPRDPVAENMAVLKGEPLKAFFYQDHQSHIQVHMAAMQDPIVMQLVGQNPRAPQIQAAMMAHIAEHVGYAYRQKIEQQLGMPLPPEDEKLPPEMEIALSGMMAQAAQQVLQQSQAQAAQQQAQQQAQDPLIQMQQQELQIKQQELALKQQEIQGKLALENKRIQIDAMAKAGQLKQQKRNLQVDAMAKAGDLKNRRHQLGAQFVTQGMQQKHEMSQKHKDLGAQIVQEAMQQRAQQNEENPNQ